MEEPPYTYPFFGSESYASGLPHFEGSFFFTGLFVMLCFEAIFCNASILYLSDFVFVTHSQPDLAVLVITDHST